MAGGTGEFLRGYRAFWVYTLARFALFGGIAVLLWLAGVPFLLAALIAVAVSVPLSWFLLRRPREAFAATIEARVDHRRERSRDLEARLAGDDTPPSTRRPSPVDEPGVSEQPARNRAKRR